MEDGRVLVSLPDSPVEISAWSLVPLNTQHVGRQAALMPQGRSRTALILIGLVEAADLQSLAAEPRQATAPATLDVELDDEKRRIELTAAEQVTLRCGAASITLTRAGKILVKGEYVLTQAKGVNRVRGGSVLIN